MIPPSVSWKLGLGVIVLFWLAVILTDYPAPFIDDLWYIGAALNLVQHGQYSNPYCEMLTAVGSGPGHLYLAYMPIENYVVAGWLSLFGISALSFHLLFTLLAFAASLLIYRLFPATGVAPPAALLICLAVYGLLGGTGLRADALGLCFFLCGFDLWRARSAAGFGLRNLFLALTVITFPNLGLVAMSTTVAGLLYQARFVKLPAREIVRHALAAAAAYASCLAIFLVLIQGHLFQFLAAMTKNQQMSALGVRDRFELFTALGVAKWLVVQTSFLVAVTVLVFRWKSDPAQKRGIFLLGCLLAGFAILLYASCNSATGAHFWAFGCLMALLYLLVSERKGVLAWLLYLAIFAITAFGHDHIAIGNALADPPPSPEKKRALLAEIAALNPPRLYVDTYALRELYDYKLPPNTFAFETSSTTGWGDPTSYAALPKNAVFVVTAGRGMPTPRSPAPVQGLQPLKILGHPIPGVARNPYDLVIMDNRD